MTAVGEAESPALVYDRTGGRKIENRKDKVQRRGGDADTRARLSRVYNNNTQSLSHQSGGIVC